MLRKGKRKKQDGRREMRDGKREKGKGTAQDRAVGWLPEGKAYSFPDGGLVGGHGYGAFKAFGAFKASGAFDG